MYNKPHLIHYLSWCIRNWSTDDMHQVRYYCINEGKLRKDDSEAVHRHFEAKYSWQNYNRFAAGQVSMPPGAQENFARPGAPPEHLTICEMSYKRRKQEEEKSLIEEDKQKSETWSRFKETSIETRETGARERSEVVLQLCHEFCTLKHENTKRYRIIWCVPQ